MKFATLIILLSICLYPATSVQAQGMRKASFDFAGQTFQFSVPPTQNTHYNLLTQQGIQTFYESNLDHRFDEVVRSLNFYRAKNKPDDWLFYQLIRRTAQLFSPKEKDYLSYTLHKWYFLNSAGFDAVLTISGSKMLFYVQCNENIYNVPSRAIDGKQYVCLNYHDYGTIDFTREKFSLVNHSFGGVPKKVFSYKVTRVPDFNAAEYLEKDLRFSYYENEYNFRVKLSPQVQKLFVNYPVVDFAYYLNIPLSTETYNSFIPQLKKNVKGMSQKHGVDYLMRFTRYAFLFEVDSKTHGSEKRLSPEQTLFYDQSDCEDRVALFFYLVKEIYDLPMIVLTYPTHVTIAVEFDKPVGPSITYNGKKYTVCEPTPQKKDLNLGELLPELRNTPYEVAYVYHPVQPK